MKTFKSCMSICPHTPENPEWEDFFECLDHQGHTGDHSVEVTYGGSDEVWLYQWDDEELTVEERVV